MYSATDELWHALGPRVRIDRVHDERIAVFCPFHKEGRERRSSMSLYTQSGRVVCFTCGYRAPIRRFLSDLGMDREEAETLERSVRRSAPAERPRTRFPDGYPLLEGWLGTFQRYIPRALLDAGFTDETLNRFEIGWDAERARVIYPVRDERGALVALVGGRTSEDDYPKYKLYDHEVGMEAQDVRGHRRHLWGMHLLPAGVPYVVTEGYKACMWVAQAGYPAVATQGTGFTREQVNTMVRRFSPVHVMFDQDEAGVEAGRRLHEQLLREMGPRARIVRYPRADALQPDWLSADEVAAALSPPSDAERNDRGIHLGPHTKEG